MFWVYKTFQWKNTAGSAGENVSLRDIRVGRSVLDDPCWMALPSEKEKYCSFGALCYGKQCITLTSRDTWMVPDEYSEIQTCTSVHVFLSI